MLGLTDGVENVGRGGGRAVHGIADCGLGGFPALRCVALLGRGLSAVGR